LTLILLRGNLEKRFPQEAHAFGGEWACCLRTQQCIDFIECQFFLHLTPVGCGCLFSSFFAWIFLFCFDCGLLWL